MKARRPSAHLAAVLQALLVTFLWATSWVLIKLGLEDIPALTFAGLRYSLAFLCLLPFALRASKRGALFHFRRNEWIRLIWLGVLFYAVTQGAQYVSLSYLPAVTVSLLLNFTSILVALLGVFLLAEKPSRAQWAGMAVFLLGVLVYFYPVEIPAAQAIGIVIALVGVLANSLSAVLGRAINRENGLDPLLVTTVSMGVGSLLLLGPGLALQGLPPLRPAHWAIIAWLALVNTAFAFTLWNLTLRTLSAMESSLINNTMLIQIALLAWIFLGEGLTPLKSAGLALAGIGIAVVQIRRGHLPRLLDNQPLKPGSGS